VSSESWVYPPSSALHTDARPILSASAISVAPMPLSPHQSTQVGLVDALRFGARDAFLTRMSSILRELKSLACLDLPPPPTIVVFSFSIITFLARPSMFMVTFSSLMARSAAPWCRR
jgi:hypothetical protein